MENAILSIACEHWQGFVVGMLEDKHREDPIPAASWETEVVATI